MGIGNWLGFGKRPGLLDGIDGIASPFASGSTLNQVVLSDIFGGDAESMPLDRSQAITIPAVSKARNLIISTVCKFPLRALTADGTEAAQPAWLYRTDSAVTPYERLAWTLDDLIFYGYALWEVERGAAGQITRANYVPQAEWNITDGHVLIREQQVPEDSYLLINSAFEGLLAVASRTLRGARDIELNWQGKVRNPIPLQVISHVQGPESATQLPQHEIDELIADWKRSRRDVDGSVGYLSPELKMEIFGEVDPALLIEGRNAIRTDIGSYLNIPVAVLDGTVGVDSLTYSTTEGNRSRFLDDLSFWMDPIEARLSMDDVVPRGQRIRFDMSSAYATLPNPTGTPVED
jgi:hypothetical protein